MSDQKGDKDGRVGKVEMVGWLELMQGNKLDMVNGIMVNNLTIRAIKRKL